MDQVTRAVIATFFVLFGLSVVLCLAVLLFPDDELSFSDKLFPAIFATFFLPVVSTMAIAFYTLPSIVAYVRQHRNFVPILVVNLFFGGIAVGWIAAIAWAFSSDVIESRQTVRRMNESTS